MLDELREAATGNVDLLTEVAGVMFGLRSDDKNSPHYTGRTPAPSCSLRCGRDDRGRPGCAVLDPGGMQAARQLAAS
jgi:hypothetical protein